MGEVIKGVQVIEISSFEKHQRISGKESESESDFPEKQEGSIREAPGCFTESQERKGKERKGKGKEGKVVAGVTECLLIYDAYPKKVERPEAIKEIAIALKSINAMELLNAVQQYAGAVSGWPDEEKGWCWSLRESCRTARRQTGLSLPACLCVPASWPPAPGFPCAQVLWPGCLPVPG